MRLLCLRTAFLVWAALPVPVHAQSAAPEFEAKQVLLLDMATGTRLFAKESQAVVQPGNFAKLMTLALAAAAVKEGKITLETVLPVSENAWRKGGGPSRTSSMFAPLNAHISVKDLMTGIATVSANDGTLVLAEGLAEHEDIFAARMNEKATKMGLKRSHFVNATGLPATNPFTTPEDLAVIAMHLIREFPETYALFQTPEIEWSKIRQRNRNPLIGRYEGADGMMFNFVPDAGHGGIVSAVRGNRRLLAIMLGEPDRAKLVSALQGLLDKGFNDFETRILFEKDAPIARATVYGGEKRAINVGYAQGAIELLLPKAHNSAMKAVFDYNSPVLAPVVKGDAIGTLSLWRDDILQLQVPLVAQESVAESGFVKRSWDAVRELALQTVDAITLWIKARYA